MTCNDCGHTVVRDPEVGEVTECSACGARYTRDSAGLVRLD